MTTGADYTQHLIQKKARTVIAVPDENYDLRTIFTVIDHIVYFSQVQYMVQILAYLFPSGMSSISCLKIQQIFVKV